ncbi:MAG TPA: SHOCT domain-containing protein [Anaerolineae bacterium]|nr:SHOCT domain-containing protein [Anaerolineae bacterium]
MQARDLPSDTGSATVTEGDPLELARRRYARGEISREEYLSLRQDLKV